MHYLDLCDKEVVCLGQARYLGHVKDIVFDEKCGRIEAIIVPGSGRIINLFCKEQSYCIPWERICKIGPDVILVDLEEKC